MLKMLVFLLKEKKNNKNNNLDLLKMSYISGYKQMFLMFFVNNYE